MVGPERVRILAVCTGNICRSPVAEALLTRGIFELGVLADVRSAGTSAAVGQPVDPATQRLLARRGVALPDDFAARQLQVDDLRDADLILTMTLEQRREALELFPGAVRRTFTLTEFAALVSASEEPLFLDDLRPNRSVLLAASVDYDVPDPHGRRRRHHVAAYEMVDDATKAILSAILAGRLVISRDSVAG